MWVYGNAIHLVQFFLSCNLFLLWAAMFENVGPNEALTSHLTKMSEINKNQTELEDSNDQDLDLELDSDGQIKSFIFEPQYGSSSEEEEQEQEFNSHPK